MRVNQWAGNAVGSLKPLPVAQGDWEDVGVDVMAEVPISLRGNNCIMTFMDHYSISALECSPL